MFFLFCLDNVSLPNATMLVRRVLYALTLCLIPAGGVAQPNELDGRAVDPLAGTSECAVSMNDLFEPISS